MIILCDDGSLKIYVADSEKTEYWLKPHLQPTCPIMQLKAPIIWSSASLFQLSPSSILNKKNKINSIASSSTPTPTSSTNLPPTNKSQESTETAAPVATSSSNSIQSSKNAQLKRTNAIKNKLFSSKATASVATAASLSAQTTFPVDFFEKCSQIDAEYGGNDLLEIYNTQQLKSRLSLGGNKFVVSMRAQGVKLEISNVVDSARTLIMGCRILVGTHSIERSPTYFEVFERRIPVKLTRSRWFDICLTREEALIADNKLTVLIGASADSRFITVIDACICFGKSKEQVNWNKTEVQALQKKYNQTKLPTGQSNMSGLKQAAKLGKQPTLIDPLSEQKQKLHDKKTSMCEKQETKNIL